MTSSILEFTQVRCGEIGNVEVYAKALGEVGNRDYIVVDTKVKRDSIRKLISEEEGKAKVLTEVEFATSSVPIINTLYVDHYNKVSVNVAFMDKIKAMINEEKISNIRAYECGNTAPCNQDDVKFVRHTNWQKIPQFGNYLESSAYRRITEVVDKSYYIFDTFKITYSKNIDLR